ncbi:hypothetical protein Taro_038352 [Colocasia esculenta]|uniref:BED-type domain-containing protein n=1 Tax=Colocasia esculenta TaxID=4460 RepID=A0A843W391_COLES|nr:hypothetical protein [Colocasia esculenta]
MASYWKIGTTSKCNYCGFTGQGGGVSRLKKHLAGGRLAGYHDVQECKMVPREVKKLMIEHLKQVRAETARKKADKEIQERIISRRERDEDVDDEVEMFAEYVPDPDVQERRARAQSRAEAWESEQRVAHRVSFQGAQHEVGSGSAVGGAGGTQSRRFSNVGDYFTRPPLTQTQLPEQGRHSKRPTGGQIEDVDPYVYPREHSKQTRIEDAYNQQGPKYKVGRAIAKWWHHTGLPFNAANSPYYKTAIQEVQPYYLHPAYHYAHELAYEDDLTAAFTRVVERLSRSHVLAADVVDEASIGLSTYIQNKYLNMKSFREAIGTFAEPSAIAGRERVEGEPPEVPSLLPPPEGEKSTAFTSFPVARSLLGLALKAPNVGLSAKNISISATTAFS